MLAARRSRLGDGIIADLMNQGSDPSQDAMGASTECPVQILNVSVKLLRFLGDEPQLFLELGFVNMLFGFFPSSRHGLAPMLKIQSKNLECCKRYVRTPSLSTGFRRVLGWEAYAADQILKARI